MKEEEFKLLVNEFIDSIKSSELFLKYKNVNDAIYENEEIIDLNKEKEKLIFAYNHAQSEEDEEKILIQIGKITDEINKKDLAKEYYSLRSKIKELLQPIVDNVLNVIK